MSTRPAAYENLIKKGDLKATVKTPESLAQYLKIARDLLSDARLDRMSNHGKYTAAPTLTETNPLVLNKTDPGSAHGFVRSKLSSWN